MKYTVRNTNTNQLKTFVNKQMFTEEIFARFVNRTFTSNFRELKSLAFDYENYFFTASAIYKDLSDNEEYEAIFYSDIVTDEERKEIEQFIKHF